jgi:hypothetical protein
MERRCGLVNPACACHCVRQVPFALQVGMIDPAALRFATHPVRELPDEMARARLHEIERLERATAVFRSHPNYAAPAAFAGIVKRLVDSGEFRVLAG